MATTTATTPATTTPAVPKPTPLTAIPGVQGTPTDPANDLRGQTLGVAPTADRKALATDYLNTWDQSTAPQFQADLNTATSNKAATGQLGSGGLRTSLGDLTYNRDLQRNAQAKNFYNDALSGSINDAYQNVGIAQQQQQYQTALQNQTYNQNLASRQQEDQEYNDLFNQNFSTNSYNDSRKDTAFNQGVTSKQLDNATQNQQFGQNLATQQQGLAAQNQQFGQGLSLAQLQDSLTNSSFGRAATTYQLGTQGNPSQAYQNLSNQYGASAQNSFGGLTNTVAGSGSGQNTNDIISLLQSYGLLGGKTSGATIPSPTPIYSDYPSSGAVTG